MNDKVAVCDNFSFDSVVLQRTTPALVMFHATWSNPAKSMGPLFNEVAVDYSGNASFFKLDIDESPEMARKFNVRAVPTVILFKGGKVVASLVPISKGHLTDFIDKNI
ncbi:co-chaperone YbbN [Pseudomonas sp. DTU12.3]|uniref:thioredoxin family protein n=1 Tax=Pseudomonas sp. DTU12.3 TaxID=2073078 RepID=UPI0013E99839|nr:thioredoxin domain-containing protein [Pseudomonas sp. DTU12.3]